MANTMPTVAVASAFEGACGKTGISTGPKSNEFLTVNCKMSPKGSPSPMWSPSCSALTAPPSPASSVASSSMPAFPLGFVRMTSFELESVADEWNCIEEEDESDENSEESWPRSAAHTIEQFEEEEAVELANEESNFWSVTRGAAPSTEQLDTRLSDVKALFKAKFGEDVDEDSDNEDSIVWSVTRGAAPTTEQLDTRLSDVKALFKAKFGEDVDECAEDSIGTATTEPRRGRHGSCAVM